MSSAPVVVVLSTGRCGTRFAAEALIRASRGRADVRHEPIGAAYSPRYTLRAPSLDAWLATMPGVAAHLHEIERVVREGRPYVETGWPLFPWVGWLKQRYGDDLVVVHLIAEPVRFAFSMASHGFYVPALRDDPYVRNGLLTPSDQGARFRHFAPLWDQLSPVEKALYFWLEVNMWAEELKGSLSGSWLTLKASDLFDTPEQLIDGLRAAHPRLGGVLAESSAAMGLVDRWHTQLPYDVAWPHIPSEVLRLSSHYGFDPPASASILHERLPARA